MSNSASSKRERQIDTISKLADILEKRSERINSAKSYKMGTDSKSDKGRPKVMDVTFDSEKLRSEMNKLTLEE